ncbi:hypothetical protein UFOVP415_51 [uncultured Caudovirales phage]|uniref:Uncharacterized protein n=1 Tax=uncultured Caudovirales phage TaxID=2100421 RepID=A0A6J5M8D1_9CAUD|nr:hypothetical protein UFOVP415_51 [uncultured Caudovirales phage]
MSLTSYADLQTSIAGYLARSDLTSQIPDFIRLSELRLRRDLRIRQMLKSVTTATVAADNTVELPSDFLEVRDLFIVGNPVQPLTYYSPSAFNRNARTWEVGKPRDYTVLANDFQLAPIPDTVYTVQMLYFAAPAFLSDTNTSNVFLANTPDALLYGALLEAAPWLMDDARLNTWGSLFDRAMVSIKRSDEQGQYSGVPLSIRTVA